MAIDASKVQWDEPTRAPSPSPSAAPPIDAGKVEWDPPGQSPSAGRAPGLRRSIGQIAKDTGIGVAQGAANMGMGLAQLGNLATFGGLDAAVVKPGQRLADRLAGGTGEDAGGIAGASQRINESLDERKSPQLRQSQQELAESRGVLPTLKRVVTDPMLLGQFASEQVPILATLGAGTIGTAGRAAGAAARRGATPAAAQEAGRNAAIRSNIGATGALGAGFAGNETVQEVLEQPDEIWRANPEFNERVSRGEDMDAVKESMALRAGQIAAGVAGAASAATAGLTARLETDIFTRNLPVGGARALLTRPGMAQVGNAIARETAEEAVQEGAEQFSQNLGVQRVVDPERGLMKGVPEAATIGGTVGGMIGGGLGAGGVATSRPRLQQTTDAAPAPGSLAEAAQTVTETQAGPVLALPPPVIRVRPDGKAATESRVFGKEQAREQRQIDFASERAELGLTPDVNAARSRHPAAIPNQPRLRYPTAAPGSLSDAANVVPAPAQAPPPIGAAEPNALPADSLSRTTETATQEAGWPRRAASPPANLDPETGQLLPTTAEHWPAAPDHQQPGAIVRALKAEAARNKNRPPGVNRIAETYNLPRDAARELRLRAISEMQAEAGSPRRADGSAAPQAQQPPAAATDTAPAAEAAAATAAPASELSARAADATTSPEAAEQSNEGRPRLGNTVQEVVEAWRAARPHGADGPETAVARVPGMPGEFQWGPDGQLLKRMTDRHRNPYFFAASTAEEDAVLDAIAQGQAEIRTSGTRSAYADRSGTGQVLHQATGRPLEAPAGDQATQAPGPEVANPQAVTDESAALEASTDSGEVGTSSVDGDVATAAAQAATSPSNSLPEPTDAQKEAGNYKKGHVRLDGHDISIENPAGSRRNPDWEPLQDAYGYIRGTVGKDKDHVDVFMTERAGDASLPVFVVDQVDQRGRFDEHKVVMGTATEAEARATYLRNYRDGWTGLGGITQMTQDQFKAWVRDPAATGKRAARSVKRHPPANVSRTTEGTSSQAPPAAERRARPDERAAADALPADARGTARLTFDRALQLKADITSQWGENAPRVILVENAEGFPAFARVGSEYRRAEGLYNGQHTVWLNVAGVRTEKRFAEVLAHEALGHYGVERIVGRDWSGIVEAIGRHAREGTGGSALRAAIRDVRIRYGDTDATTFAKEVLAVMAERGVRNGLVDRVVAAVRRYLRQIMPGLQWSRADVVGLLGQADSFLRADRSVGTQREAVAALAFSRRQAVSEFLQGEAIATASSDAFQRVDGQTLRQQVESYFDEVKSADNPQIGTVRLGKRGIRSSIAHGISRSKAAAFTLVPDVVARGRVIDETIDASGQSANRHVIGAPVRIGGEDFLMGVVVRQQGGTPASFYLHEVMLTPKEKPRQAIKTASEAAEPQPSIGGPAGAIARLPPAQQKAQAVPFKTGLDAQGRASDGGTTGAIARLLLDAYAGNRDAQFSRAPAHLSMDGRGQRRIEMGGETFLERGERFYLTDSRGRPHDFRTLSAATDAAQRTGGEVLLDDTVEGEPTTWSVGVPEMVVREVEAPRSLWSLADHLTEAQREALRKIDTFAEPPPLRDKLSTWTERWQQKLIQGVFDQFAPLKALDDTAYAQARLSKGTDGAVEAAFRYGPPKLTDDALDVAPDGQGLQGVLQSLAGEHDLFFAWVAGNRARRLMREGREHLFNEEEITALTRLHLGKMADGRDRRHAYDRAHRAFNRYQKAVLDIAEKSGLVDADHRQRWEHEFYVPFYRVMEGSQAIGPGQLDSLTGQKAFQRLKGGEEPLGDLLANTLSNWSHLLSGSMKNMAARRALRAAETMGAARQVAGAEKGSVAVMESGKQRHYTVSDPLVLDALTMLHHPGWDNPAMKGMRWFKRALTIGVTVDPSFRIRNLMRDTLSAIATNRDIGFNPLRNLVDGWQATKSGSETYMRMLGGGGAIRFGTLLDGDQAANAKRLITAGVKGVQILDNQSKVKAAFGRVWDHWQEIGDRAETVNRAAIYQRARAEGKSHLEASLAARDLLDFTMGGKWAAVRFLMQIVPFMNARLQGMYKLGRAAKGDAARFAAVTGAIAMASVLLHLLNEDDDEYRALPDWVRDTYWWVRLPGTEHAFYIPKPFEVGALGSVVERATELMTGGDDYRARDFASTLAGILGDQLAMNPVPQAVKPAMEAAFNWNTFQSRPIDSMGQERLPGADRYTARTSAGAVALGRALDYSPQRIEHMVRGYFGWLGMQALNVSDLAGRSVMDLPANPQHDMSRVGNTPVLGSFIRPTAGGAGNKYLTRYYQQQREIDQIYAAYSEARRAGDYDRARELAGRDEMRLRRLYLNADRQMNRLNQQIRRVTNDRRLSAAEKAEMLEGLHEVRNRVAESTTRRARAAVTP